MPSDPTVTGAIEAHSASEAPCQVAETRRYNTEGRYIIPRGELRLYAKCSGFESYGCGALWRNAADAPRISGRKKPWCEERGEIVGAPCAKWLPTNRGSTWQIRWEEGSGHIVSPQEDPIDVESPQMYRCAEKEASWPARSAMPDPDGVVRSCAPSQTGGPESTSKISSDFILPVAHLSKYQNALGGKYPGFSAFGGRSTTHQGGLTRGSLCARHAALSVVFPEANGYRWTMGRRGELLAKYQMGLPYDQNTP